MLTPDTRTNFLRVFSELDRIKSRLRRLELGGGGGGGGGGGDSTYLRPDGVSGYIRPTGPFTYIRP